MEYDLFSVIFSIVFGVVLGVILYGTFKPPVILHGPDSRDVVGKIYYYDNKKYILEPKIYLRTVKNK